MGSKPHNQSLSATYSGTCSFGLDEILVDFGVEKERHKRVWRNGSRSRFKLYWSNSVRVRIPLPAAVKDNTR